MSVTIATVLRHLARLALIQCFHIAKQEVTSLSFKNLNATNYAT